jgi:hypothetical protein
VSGSPTGSKSPPTRRPLNPKPPPPDPSGRHQDSAIALLASAEYGVPGADDAAIFTDIVRSLGRDRNAVRKALAMRREIAGGDLAVLDEAKAEAAAMALLGCEGPMVMALGRAVWRDVDRAGM